MKFTCVERALSAYGHFAAKAGEVGGHVHCRACDRTRKPDFWQAARGSDGWLQCDSKSCDTWWCSGCVMVAKTPRSLDGAKAGTYIEHRRVCVAAAAATAALEAVTPAKRTRLASEASMTTPSTARARTGDESTRTSTQTDERGDDGTEESVVMTGGAVEHVLSVPNVRPRVVGRRSSQMAE
jgi:hypothetical protein